MFDWKAIAQRVPGLPAVYRRLRSRYDRVPRAGDAEQVFTEIYRRNAWNGKDSVSGTGSDVEQTRELVRLLPTVFQAFGISTMLDLPCGDFFWMREVDLSNIDYTGADIVDELIQKNASTYERDNVRFLKLNLIEDELPTVDLVLCRDCLVHFSFDDVFRALDNLCASGSGYVLTTTFTERAENHDIVTGQWRALNLERAPFLLPPPLQVIHEGCTEGGGAYRDKALGLWHIDAVRASLTRTAS